MATIVLSNGQRLSDPQQLKDLLATRPVKVRRLVDAERVAAGLASIEAEWIEATGGQLQAVTVNLRLLFEDLREALA